MDKQNMEQRSAHEKRFVESFMLLPDINKCEEERERLAGILKSFNWNEEDSDCLTMAYTEALSNAMLYGSLGLEGGKGENKIDMEPRALEAFKKLQTEKKLPKVSVIFSISGKEATITVENSGPEFDPSTVADPTSSENIKKQGGRGLFFMRTYVDDVRYENRGRRVILYKKRGQA